MTRMGANVSCAPLFYFFCTLIYIIKIIYLYPPTRVWGTGLGGGTKAQPVPQPQLNPWVSPTHDNPYHWFHHLPGKEVCMR